MIKIESPRLKPGCMDYWANEWRWFCARTLRKMFDIPRGADIQVTLGDRPSENAMAIDIRKRVWGGKQWRISGPGLFRALRPAAHQAIRHIKSGTYYLKCYYYE